MTEFALQIWALSRWLTKGHISPRFKFKFNRLTQISPLLHLSRCFRTPKSDRSSPSAQSETTWTCQHIKQQLRSTAAAFRSVFWCLLNKTAWDCSPSPCGLSSGCKESESLTAHQASPPRGPGTGGGRLTNCKGYNWAAHKLFALHKGIGSNKCHKPIMR